MSSADEMKEKLGDMAAQAARTATESNVDQVQTAIEERYGAILDPARRLVAFVRAYPLTTTLGAATIGFVFARTRG